MQISEEMGKVSGERTKETYVNITEELEDSNRDDYFEDPKGKHRQSSLR